MHRIVKSRTLAALVLLAALPTTSCQSRSNLPRFKNFQNTVRDPAECKQMEENFELDRIITRRKDGSCVVAYIP